MVRALILKCIILVSLCGRMHRGDPALIFFNGRSPKSVVAAHLSAGRKDLELFPLAECACYYGTCYARRMRLLPWCLLCTPNAPAAVVPAMHAEYACCRGTCYAHRMRLLLWHLLCTPNAPAAVVLEQGAAHAGTLVDTRVCRR
jgi:hypothetical protein